MTEFYTELASDQALEQALAAPRALVYKHSPLCGLSDLAFEQVAAFARERPDVPVYLLDVIRHRALARAVADRLEIRHESPQAILLERGHPIWNASHRAVTADALRDRLKVA